VFVEKIDQSKKKEEGDEDEEMEEQKELTDAQKNKNFSKSLS